MKRSEFLRQLGLVSGGVALGLDRNIQAKAFSYNPFMVDLSGTNGNILVLLQLGGGNDGLNTVIPFEDANYYNQRPTVAIKKTDVLGLNTLTGLNPAMGAIRNLYNDGKVNIVQSVGYASPNQSHFRSTDIWLSASDANQVLTEGWAGRYLSKTYPDFPIKTPAEPMAIQLGSVESMLLESRLGPMGTVFDDPNTFYQLVSGSTADSDPPPATIAGDELKYLKQVAAQSLQYSGVIKEKADKGKNVITYPNTGLGRQLSIVAKLISGGGATPVYLTTMGGFDTHANQVSQHFTLWKTVSDAIASFQMDIERQGLGDKVTLMTFSEFGRRVNQNATNGTDHGSAAPLFVIGKTVRGGIIGANPNLSDLDGAGNIKFKNDYRQIYNSVLRDHLGMSQADAQSVLLKDFDRLPIFKSSAEQFTSTNDFALSQNYPNPASDITRIKYEINKKQDIRLTLTDMRGQELAVMKEETAEPGLYDFGFDVRNLSNGIYLYSMTGSGSRQTLRMVVQR
jgi:uncharacterized protein (DUF1501 family)